MTALAAPVAPVRETVERKTGTITLTETPEGWTIRGVSSKYTVHGRPLTYVATVPRCDCRTNAKSTRRRGALSNRYSTHANVGTRELCPKAIQHNGTCHRTRDHCPSRGHEAKIRALFEAVVKSYR